MAAITLTGTPVRVLKALASVKTAGGSLTRKQIESDEGGADDASHTSFAITAPGRAAASKAPEHPVRGNGSTEHKSLPKVGESFTKTYNGKDYKVTRTEAGFRYAGKEYASLTATAKAVRGTDQEVNGWLFFGFVKPKAGEAKPAKTTTGKPKAKKAKAAPAEAPVPATTAS